MATPLVRAPVVEKEPLASHSVKKVAGSSKKVKKAPAAPRAASPPPVPKARASSKSDAKAVLANMSGNWATGSLEDGDSDDGHVPVKKKAKKSAGSKH